MKNQTEGTTNYLNPQAIEGAVQVGFEAAHKYPGVSRWSELDNVERKTLLSDATTKIQSTGFADSGPSNR